jgi:hypothetical protein
MSARCKDLQGQMLAWAANEGGFPKDSYDGTVASLARRYFSDEFSPYRNMKWNSQIHHDKCGKIIVATVGARQVRKLLGPDFKRWAASWGAPADEGRPVRPWRAKHCIDAVRRMIAYGVTCGYDDCMRADTILGKLRFPTPPARSEILTLDQTIIFCRKAHEMGVGSLALATMIQHETTLRQKDVIGEWVPDIDAKGGIQYRNKRWMNGITWANIDRDMILRRTPGKTARHGINVEHDLKLLPLVMSEIAQVPPEKRVGPVIISEATGEPYKNRTFTQTWRRVADAAGLPRNVQNRDARAGGITEAYDAGATTNDAMKLAGHTDPRTSAKYNRRSLKQASRAASLRERARKKKDV